MVHHVLMGQMVVRLTIDLLTGMVLVQEKVLPHQVGMVVVVHLLEVQHQTGHRMEMALAREVVALPRQVDTGAADLLQQQLSQTEEQTQVMAVIGVHLTPLIQVTELVDRIVVIATIDLLTQITE